MASDLKREGTMQATLREAEAILGKDKGDKDQENGTSEKPKMERAGTMQVTAEEAKEILGDEPLEKTRGATATLQEALKANDDEETEEKTDDQEKPSLARASTMQVTADEAKEILGDEERGKTRRKTQAREERASSSSQDNDKEKPSVQRTKTMAATAQEGAELIGDENLGKTRSQTQKQTPTKPAPKRTSTMAQTAADGEEFLKRTKTDSSSDEPTTEAQKAEN